MKENGLVDSETGKEKWYGPMVHVMKENGKITMHMDMEHLHIA